MSIALGKGTVEFQIQSKLWRCIKNKEQTHRQFRFYIYMYTSGAPSCLRRSVNSSRLQRSILMPAVLSLLCLPPASSEFADTACQSFAVAYDV